LANQPGHIARRDRLVAALDLGHEVGKAAIQGRGHARGPAGAATALAFEILRQRASR